MKHESKLAVFRTQRHCSLRLDETFVGGEINPKLRFGALTNSNDQVPFKFRSGISLCPTFDNIRCDGPAAIANLPSHLKLFLPRKLLRKL